jgi:DNA invertase Pin-like site-specific DNA recombinase
MKKADKTEKLLKAKIAMALQNEYQRVPSSEEIEHVFHLTRVMYKAVLGLHYRRQEQKKIRAAGAFLIRLMLIGYARVSTLDQTLDLQQDALTAAGCEQLYTDTASGASTDRPGLTLALAHLRAGDTLIVWRLDRLGRSLAHLIDTIRDLQERGVGFRSLQEQIDTTTSGGKLIFHVFGALAEFERDLIRERTHAGLAAARARGRLFGRPKVLTPQQVKQLRSLAQDDRNTVAEICQTLGISKATYYRYLPDRK